MIMIVAHSNFASSLRTTKVQLSSTTMLILMKAESFIGSEQMPSKNTHLSFVFTYLNEQTPCFSGVK